MSVWDDVCTGSGPEAAGHARIVALAQVVNHCVAAAGELAVSDGRDLGIQRELLAIGRRATRRAREAMAEDEDLAAWGDTFAELERDLEAFAEALVEEGSR